MKFAIYMDRWLRGEGSARSRLQRRDDGKRCCVGEYCIAKGVPEARIIGFDSLAEIKDPEHDILIPESTLEGDGSPRSGETIAGWLYSFNDRIGVADEDRIPWIRAGFEALGHEVEFLPGWGPQ